MSVRITGIAEVKRQFAAIEEFLASPKPMEGIVADIKDVILIKTSSGLDYMGRGFKPYSEKYAKKKKGMTATGRPNLKASGTMLGAIKTEVINPRHGAVFVSLVGEPRAKISSLELAEIHNEGKGKQPQREFMNLAKSAVQKLTKKHYDDPILILAKAARGR